MSTKPIGSTTIWGEDIKLLSKLSEHGSMQLFGLSRGHNKMSSYPMRGRLVKLRRIGLVDYDEPTMKYTITDIGRDILTALSVHWQETADSRFDYTFPGWNKTLAFLSELAQRQR